MNTQITFTVQGQMTPFTEVVSSTTHLTDAQAQAHIQALVNKHGILFRGKPAKVKIVSLITK